VSNWINDFVRPKFRGILRTNKPELPDNLWVKCPETGQMVYHKELEENQFVFPGSNVHMKMTATQRLEALFDDRKYSKIAVPGVPLDPLKFRDEKRYTDRLKAAKENTSLDDAVLVGDGTLDGRRVTAAVQDFRFMGGSLGMAAGEAVVTGMLHAAENGTPFIIFAASGGARMQEGILSLMQMPRTTIAVQRLRDANLPYLVVLTNPTTGGVTASYAMLGDVHIAEPGALIGFAGPRVIKQTIRENLPDGFQRAEYLLEHGMIDMVVHRHQLRETLSRLCGVLMDGDVHGRHRTAGRRKGLNGAHTGNGTADPRKGEKRAPNGHDTSKDLVIEAEPVKEDDRVDSGRFFGGATGQKERDAKSEGKSGKTPVPAKTGSRF
jgi:acetyl-CoA carboxylase carboxyl transferase subunit beta